jgi:hypothetical protein
VSTESLGDGHWLGGDADLTVTHAIHVDVIRLSRHYPWLPASTGSASDHIQRIERILYVFSKRSSPTGYNQGFHELLMPLYYVALMGGNEFGLDMETCEGITYFLMHWLINGTLIGEFFLCEAPEPIIRAISERSFRILKLYDPLLYQTMFDNDVAPVLFAFSWLTVVFTQVYELPVVLKLWDFLFADIEKMELNLTVLVTAHLMSLRYRFIGKTFGQIMKEFNGLELASEVPTVNLSRFIIQSPRFLAIMYE